MAGGKPCGAVPMWKEAGDSYAEVHVNKAEVATWKANGWSTDRPGDMEDAPAEEPLEELEEDDEEAEES